RNIVPQFYGRCLSIYSSDQRVHVAADGDWLVPVWMAVILQRAAGFDYVPQMSFPPVPALVNGQAIQYGLIGSLLQIQIQRGIDPHARLMHLVSAIFLLQVTTYFLHKIRC